MVAVNAPHYQPTAPNAQTLVAQFAKWAIIIIQLIQIAKYAKKGVLLAQARQFAKAAKWDTILLQVRIPVVFAQLPAQLAIRL